MDTGVYTAYSLRTQQSGHVGPGNKEQIMEKIICIIIAFLLSLCAFAQRNEIYSPRIASLQVVAGDDWLSPPVINLTGESPIHISFDDLTHDYHRYSYQIQHCEADWSPSTGIFASDYIEGFSEGNTIDDYIESLNTNVLYTHYSLQIPNDRCKLKMSGNYTVTVYDEDDDSRPVFKACFMVVEPRMGVGLGMTTNTDIDINGSHQQLVMEVAYNGLQVTDPATQVKTVVMQNGRWDNAVVNPNPQFISQDGLKWDHNRSLIFSGGNEYHKFEMLDVNHTTMGMESIHWDGSQYHAYFWEDEPRPSYIYDESANGGFYIRNSDNEENDRLCEYLTVHFRLKAPRQNGTVYLNGTWTNDQFLPIYQMTYNDIDQCYEGTVVLKQGYYSYQYLLMKQDGTTSFLSSEGSFYQTENAYQAFVYYRGIGERTDRLVGYQQIHTR